MKFLVIPEDFRKDQYILLPIIQNLLASLGFANPKVKVCRDPLMGGVTEALKKERLAEVFERYEGMIDVYILCVDRDADSKRRARLHELETHFHGHASLIASDAWEELETWLLAGVELPTDWAWRDVRTARDVKERYFEPLARDKGLSSEPGGGRRTLGRHASARIQRIRQLCIEDFDVLARRLEALRP